MQSMDIGAMLWERARERVEEAAAVAFGGPLSARMRAVGRGARLSARRPAGALRGGYQTPKTLPRGPHPCKYLPISDVKAQRAADVGGVL